MSLSNYSELQAAVADNLARDDASARIPDFVQMTEARFNRRLRDRSMQSTSTLTITNGAATLPTDYLEWQRATWVGQTAGRIAELKYASPNSDDWIRRFRPGGDPQLFTIQDAIYIKPIPTGSNALGFWHFRKVPALATNSTNSVLTAHPDLYLYTTLVDALLFLGDEERAQTYFAMLAPEFQATLFASDSGKIGRRLNAQAEAADRAVAKTNAGL